MLVSLAFDWIQTRRWCWKKVSAVTRVFCCLSWNNTKISGLSRKCTGAFELKLWEVKRGAPLKCWSSAVMFAQVCISQSVMSAPCKWALAAATQESSTALLLHSSRKFWFYLYLSNPRVRMQSTNHGQCEIFPFTHKISLKKNPFFPFFGLLTFHDGVHRQKLSSRSILNMSTSTY